MAQPRIASRVGPIQGRALPADVERAPERGEGRRDGGRDRPQAGPGGAQAGPTQEPGRRGRRGPGGKPAVDEARDQAEEDREESRADDSAADQDERLLTPRLGGVEGGRGRGPAVEDPGGEDDEETEGGDGEGPSGEAPATPSHEPGHRRGEEAQAHREPAHVRDEGAEGRALLLRALPVLGHVHVAEDVHHLVAGEAHRDPGLAAVPHADRRGPRRRSSSRASTGRSAGSADTSRRPAGSRPRVEWTAACASSRASSRESAAPARPSGRRCTTRAARPPAST